MPNPHTHTVGDLIATLQTYPADTRVVVDGYETALDTIAVVEPVHVQEREVGDAFWEGQFVITGSGTDKTDQLPRVGISFDALRLGRSAHNPHN